MKSIRVVIFFLVSLSLVSCIDIFQNLSKDKNGNTRVYLKVSISKSLLNFSDDSSEAGNICEDTFGNVEAEFIPSLPEEVSLSLKKIETSDECGIAMDLSYNPRSKSIQQAFEKDEEAPFMPREKRESIVIGFPSTSDYSTGEEIGLAMLSSFKYRLTISKTYLPSVSKAVLSMVEIDYKPAVIELNDMWIIEIPMNYLFSSSKKCELIVYK